MDKVLSEVKSNVKLDNFIIEPMFAILDAKSCSFGPPFCAKSVGDAIRSFDRLVNDKGNDRSLIAQYPEDFFLYRIGSYNSTLGELKPCILENVANGVDFRKSEK